MSAATLLPVWLCACIASAASCGDLERSFWISLTLTPAAKGYWTMDPGAADVPAPKSDEIARACDLLTRTYHANRLYLVYHKQCPEATARDLMLCWRRAAAGTAELVPTFVPMDYSAGPASGAPVFTEAELAAWSSWCEEVMAAPAIALYDVYPRRPWDWAVEALRSGSSLPVGWVGTQPEEPCREGLSFVVVDTWGGISAYRSNADWESRGRGLVERWARAPRPGVRAVFDLIAVAWDYDYSGDGGAAPPYDDERDDPLPAGRNQLAARTVRAVCPAEAFGGFSSDLLVLDAHTRLHGEDLYGDLRTGTRYRGMFAEPLDEIGRIYEALGDERQST